MPLFLIKSIIALFLLITASTAAFSMLTLLGKAEKKTDPAVLRKIHRSAGFVFCLLLLVLIVLGADVSFPFGHPPAETAQRPIL
jgi:hypothetical protein